MRNWARLAVSLSVFLCVWELLGRSGIFPKPLFPPPTRVAVAMFAMMRNGLGLDILVSLERAAVGWMIGSLVGIVVGLITGRNATLDGYLSPIIQVFRPLPPVAIIPIIIVWFGIGDVSKLFSIAFAVFFPVWINAHLGAQKIPPSFIWGAKSLKADRMTIMRNVIFPGSLPFIAAGLRTGVAVAFVMVYVSELAGASAGLGYEINASYLAYRVDQMFAALIVLGALGYLADVGVEKGLYAVFPWLKYASQK